MPLPKFKKGSSGYTVLPDHKIRLIDQQYRQAKNLAKPVRLGKAGSIMQRAGNLYWYMFRNSRLDLDRYSDDQDMHEAFKVFYRHGKQGGGRRMIWEAYLLTGADDKAIAKELHTDVDILGCYKIIFFDVQEILHDKGVMGELFMNYREGLFYGAQSEYSVKYIAYHGGIEALGEYLVAWHSPETRKLIRKAIQCESEALRLSIIQHPLQLQALPLQNIIQLQEDVAPDESGDSEIVTPLIEHFRENEDQVLKRLPMDAEMKDDERPPKFLAYNAEDIKNLKK